MSCCDSTSKPFCLPAIYADAYFSSFLTDRLGIFPDTDFEGTWKALVSFNSAWTSLLKCLSEILPVCIHWSRVPLSHPNETAKITLFVLAEEKWDCALTGIVYLDPWRLPFLHLFCSPVLRSLISLLSVLFPLSCLLPIFSEHAQK